MDPRREEMSYWWERLRDQKDNKIKLEDLKCIECGQQIPHGTISAYEMGFFIRNGAHCKKCMEKKLRRSQPWRR